MVVFHEWFPLRKEKPKSRSSREKKRSTPKAKEGSGDGNETSFQTFQPIYEIPRKQSMVEMFKEIADDNEQLINGSHEFDLKMLELQKIMENLDVIEHASSTSSESIASRYEAIKYETARCESILSEEKPRKQPQDDELTTKKSKISTPNAKKPAKGSKSPTSARKKSKFTSFSTKKFSQKTSLAYTAPIVTHPPPPSRTSKLNSKSLIELKKVTRPPPSQASVIRPAHRQDKKKQAKAQNEVCISVVNLRLD